MTVNMSGLMRAIAEKERVSRYTEAECINMAAKTIVLGSSNGKGLVQLTRKATAERIKADMHQMVTARTHKGGPQRQFTSDYRFSTIPRIIALAARWLVKRGEQPRNGSRAEMDAWRSRISSACTTIMNARIRSRAYVAAGWLWAGRDLAKFVPGQKLTRMGDGNMPVRDDGTAAQSYALAATGNNPVARVYNTSRGAGVVCTQDVFQAAIDNATHDIDMYLSAKMGAAIGKAFAKALR